MAREITVEAVLNALGRVNYLGYGTDIVSLGVIEAVEPLETARLLAASRQSKNGPLLARTFACVQAAGRRSTRGSIRRATS